MARLNGILARGGEGSALATVLVLIVVLSTIAASVLAASALQTRFIRMDAFRLQAQYAAEAGVALAMEHMEGTAEYWVGGLEPERAHLIARFEISATSTAVVEAAPFAGFIYIRSEGEERGMRRVTYGMVGGRPSHIFDHAVWLGDPQAGLVVTGRSTVSGSIVTGSLGVQEQMIRGTPFTGSLQGETVAADSIYLPYFDPRRIIDDIDRLHEIMVSGADSLHIPGRRSLPIMRLPLGGDGRSTLDGGNGVAVALFADSTMRISDLTAVPRGSVMVSGGTVDIQGSLVAHDVIVAAREHVWIAGGSILSGQILAGHDIVIGDDVHIAYPSALFSLGRSRSEDTRGGIRILNRARVDGSVVLSAGLYRPEDAFGHDRRLVLIGPDAIVRGAVYSDAALELHGTVHGTVCTRAFYFYAAPSHYTNWLKDATVDRPMRPVRFALPAGFEGIQSPYLASLHRESSAGLRDD